jgi:RNA polymerase sigma-70 factor, ECF subfamily
MMTGVSEPNEARDVALMLRVQSGDREAFTALYDRHAARAYTVAYALTRDTPLAEDVVQEAFLSLWRSRDSFQVERGAVAPWVMAIVRNRALDEIRRRSQHDRRRAGPPGADRDLPAADDVEGAVVRRDRASTLQGALDRLPAAQRDVILLAYYGELSHTEIAARLGLPDGTVKGRMRLGLEKLRAEAVARAETDAGDHAP